MENTADRGPSLLSRLVSGYGMLGVLVLLAAFFSIATIQEQQPTGEAAARSLARQLEGARLEGTTVFIIGRGGEDSSSGASVGLGPTAARLLT